MNDLTKNVLLILKEFARKNPKWIHHEFGEQDPMQVHSLIERIEANEYRIETQASECKNTIQGCSK